MTKARNGMDSPAQCSQYPKQRIAKVIRQSRTHNARPEIKIGCPGKIHNWHAQSIATQ